MTATLEAAKQAIELWKLADIEVPGTWPAFELHAANHYAAVAEALIEAREALAKIGHKMAFSSIDDTQGTHQRMDDIRKVARKIAGEPKP